MKKIFFIFVSLFIACSTAVGAYPNRPVKIIVSTGVGSGPDVQLRKLADILSKKWNQPVLVENKPGGSGILALQDIAKATPDGYTIGLLSKGDVLSMPFVHPNNPLNQVEPLAPFINTEMVIFVPVGINTLAELKQEINKKPLYTTAGIGSVHHVTAVQFLQIINASAESVPYRDLTAQAVDVGNKNAAFGIASLGSSIKIQQAGKIHYIAIASKNRYANFPNVPTVREFAGVELLANSWLTLYGNNKIPAPIRAQLEKDLQEAIASTEMTDFMAQGYYLSMSGVNLAQFKQLLAKDQQIYNNIIKQNKIELRP
jgi:tripartite-type tricarboxylate transporter receptor subunit TctC